jgi:hypothetical protein
MLKLLIKQHGIILWHFETGCWKQLFGYISQHFTVLLDQRNVACTAPSVGILPQFQNTQKPAGEERSCASPPFLVQAGIDKDSFIL